MDTAVGSRWLSGTQGPYLTEDDVVVVSASSTRNFTSGPPSDYHATLETTGTGSDQRRVLTEYDTGVVYIFYSFDPAISVEKRGLLREKTTRANQEASLSGTIYDYNASGFLSSITPADPQDTNYSIDFTYYTSGAETGWLEKIEITEGTTVVARAEYWYQDNADDLVSTPTSDLGSAGDLVQVRVSKRATNDTGTDLSIVRTTQYRYFQPGGSDEGEEHQLKMVLESDAIQRLIDYSGADSIDDPEDILELSDAAVIDSSPDPDLTLADFASRSFTYYTDELATDNSETGGSPKCLTVWEPVDGEDLETKYGGTDMSEIYGYWGFSENGLVKSETIHGACSACGSETAGGLKKEYHYLESSDLSGDPEERVYQLTIEDTVAADGTAAYRTIYGTGFKGHVLREAVLEDPLDSTSAVIWCKSLKTNEYYRTTDRRMPSAHTGVDSDAELAKFFAPNESTNDADTVSSTEGVVYTHEYDNSAGVGNGKYPTGIRVSEGTSGTAYYVSATDWVDQGSGGKTNFQQVATYTYPTATTTRSAGMKTSYSYTFWASTDDTVLKTRITTLP
ncbi:MAG: hypothetical protein KDA57_20040, partial [Planctomycetales bacterium]|nr:hypothetical protein [Planctomycetales bacterium]